MRRLLHLRPSPALVISFIALFVAMGGVSYGFATGTIDSREIKNGAVTTKDIRNNEVRGADIRNSTIGGRDVALDTLGGNDIKESTLGRVPDADRLDGLDGSEYVRKANARFAALMLTAGRTVVSGETVPAYAVDDLGYVHLRGTLTGGDGMAFTLPQIARSLVPGHYVVRDGTTGTAILSIAATGEATLDGASGDVSLDGVTFAAGS